MTNSRGTWTAAIADHRAHLLAIGLMASSLDAYGYRLAIASRMLEVDPWAVRPEDLVGLFQRMRANHWTADTLRSHRTALRSFYRWAADHGHVPRSPALAIPRVRPAKPRSKPTPDRMYADALHDASPRERLMLQLAAEHGLRRCEVAVVHSRDLVEELEGWSLLVHGKGGRERVVPLTPEVARRLRDLSAGYAFPGGAGDGHVSAWWTGRLLSRLMPEGWTMHKLRHRAGNRWYAESDHDIALVQDLLGHADIKTTRIYVATDAARARAVVNAAAA